MALSIPDLRERRERTFLVLAGIFLCAMTLLNVIGITRFVQLGPMALAVGVHFDLVTQRALDQQHFRELLRSWPQQLEVLCELPGPGRTGRCVDRLQAAHVQAAIASWDELLGLAETMDAKR